MSDSANVQLIQGSNNNGVLDAGEALITEARSGDEDEFFSRRTLGTGNYFVRVFRAGSTDTNYTLTAFTS